jgi:SSS family solute:Na+ symporter
MDPLAKSSISIHGVDLTILVVYLVGIVLAGVYLTRLASRDVDSYFLGGRRMPWWLLGLSGTSSYFDVTGVMWTIAFFYIMGQRFLWIQWEWGFVTMACFAAFMGKWLRRSKVMTGAEWMIIRFGNGAAGQLARTSYAVLAVVIAVAFIGFAEYGCGKFLNKFIPTFEPHTLAVTLIALTAIYTISGGLYGVVLTDLIQFCLILLGSLVLIAKAIDMSSYSVLADRVPAEWFGFRPMWHWDRLEQWELTREYSLFFMLAVVWVVKGVFLSLGGPQQLYDMQRFLAARSPREAGKAGMIWGVAMTPMFMVSAAVGVIGLMTWGDGLPHPEDLYPVVVGTMLPIGVKGLVLAGLLSAFMSTFSSTVNAGAAYLVRDGYQQFLRPRASGGELIWASRASSALVVAAGVLVGMQARNIDDIFQWIMITLGTAVLMPNVLRWFWWRFNGWGYAVGTLCGVISALVAAIWFANVPVYISFFILLAISVVSCVVASILTPPAELETLKNFYRRIRPPGFWGPVKAAVSGERPMAPSDSFARDLLSAVVGAAGLHCLFMMACYVCTKQWQAAAWSLVRVAVSGLILYFTWYKHLPDEHEDATPDAT